MKNLLFGLVVLMSAGLCLVSCSSNEDEVKTVYHVLDKNGQEDNVIKYGEEFVLELIIENNIDYALYFKDYLELVRDAFIVYNAEGQQFNPILTDDLMMRPITIEPGDQFCRRLIWPWSLVPLPPGKYYSSCTLIIGKMSYKTYTVDFEII